jgi:aldehyde dehydrogenase (NAD+)
VGKIVHAAAAEHLTPSVLELGGKNPTIVHSSANLRLAARRIAFGRSANGGQICTARHTPRTSGARGVAGADRA